MNKTVVKRPKSLFVVGLLFLVGGLLYSYTTALLIRGFINSQVIPLGWAFGFTLILVISLVPYLLIPVFLAVSVLALLSAYGLIAFRPWSRKASLISVYIAIGTDLLYALYASGFHSPPITHASEIVLLLIIVWFFYRKIIRDIFPPDRFSLKADMAFMIVPVVVIYLAAWVYLGGYNIVGVEEANLGKLAVTEEGRVAVFPERFTLKVPSDCVLIFVDTSIINNSMLLDSQLDDVKIMFNSKSNASYWVGSALCYTNAANPYEASKMYYNDRYTLLAVSLKDLTDTYTDHVIRHVSHNGFDMFLESGQTYTDKKYRYRINADVFRDGQDLGDIFITSDNTEQPITEFLDEADGILATIATPDETRTAEDYYRSGMEHTDAGEYEDAKLDLATAMLSDSKNVEYIYGLALAYKKAGNLRAAKVLITETLGHHPDNKHLDGLLKEIEALSKSENS